MPDAVLADYSKAIQCDDNRLLGGMAYNNRGITYARPGLNTNWQLADFNQAIQIDANDVTSPAHPNCAGIQETGQASRSPR